MAHEVYRMQNNKIENLSFTLLYITHSEYEKSWHSTPHSHHFTELFYIVSGVGSFILPDREITVKENDLVVINPNIEHTEKSNEHDSLEYIALGINGLAFNLIPDETEIPVGLFTYQGNRQEILFHLNKLISEVQKQDEGYELVCQNIINILIIKLKRAKNITVESHNSKNMNHSVALVKHYINHNYHNNLTLDMLAEAGNISKYYLAHRFKEEIGMSPIEYLVKTRVENAKILLDTTDFSVSVISESTGFSSQSLFAQIFRRYMNQSPSHYRKQMNEKHVDS